MKLVFTLLFVVFIADFASGQSLKKKQFGLYVGEIPAYSMEMGEEVITVKAVSIQIELKEDGTCTQQIGMDNRSGTYTILSEEKTFYMIEMRLAGQQIVEQIQLFKKGKNMKRSGIFPQPATNLVLRN